MVYDHRREAMNARTFERWLGELDALTPEQRERLR